MRYNIYVCFIAMIGFVSCEESDTVAAIDELSVEAFLHPGEPIDSVKFGRVIPLDSTNIVAAPDDLEALILLENGEQIPLFYSGVEGIYQNLDYIIEDSSLYALEVSYNDKIIKAETFIPSAATNATLSSTTISRQKISDISDLLNMDIPDPIEVNWEGKSGDYYFVHVRSIEESPEVINTLFEDGQAPALPNLLTEPTIQSFYAINSFLDITHFGWYEVVIYTVNPEYVALYEDNSSGSGSLNEIRTNVQNGFGIFTGINSRKLFFEVKKQ